MVEGQENVVDHNSIPRNDKYNIPNTRLEPKSDKESPEVPQTTCRTHAVHPRDQDDPYDDAHPKGENSAKRQKTSEYGAYVSGESSSG
nr:hypothetical protein [Tanacetum cinerariifolium]